MKSAQVSVFFFCFFSFVRILWAIFWEVSFLREAYGLCDNYSLRLTTRKLLAQIDSEYITAGSDYAKITPLA